MSYFKNFYIEPTMTPLKLRLTERDIYS